MRIDTKNRERGEHTDITPQDVLNLLLLETTLDNETSGSVNRAVRTHFSKHELNNVFRRSVHPLANITHIRKHGLLVPFTKNLRGCDGVPLAGGREEGRVRSV